MLPTKSLGLMRLVFKAMPGLADRRGDDSPEWSQWESG
ncbi:MAG: hypothetical protein CM15mP3_04940 [Candidatus Poseidoniales archaeon]|nr:MAG: hypothetical protein CM15mP3_04940 [Candidatus Poseidoniales archaeon]